MLRTFVLVILGMALNLGAKEEVKLPAQAFPQVPAILADQVVQLGQLEVRLLEGGYVQGPGGFYPKVRLQFKNLDEKRHFHKNINVEFFDPAQGLRLSSSKTFLNLKPGQSLQRGYAKARGLAWASLEAAPAVTVQIRDKALSTGPLPLVRRQILP